MRGFRLSAEAHGDIGAVDLTSRLERFTGSALLLSISRSGRPSPSIGAFAVALTSGGASVEQQVVQDPYASQFGEFRWRTVEGGQSKRDTQLELNEKIAAATAAWAVASATPAAVRSAGDGGSD